MTTMNHMPYISHSVSTIQGNSGLAEGTQRDALRLDRCIYQQHATSHIIHGPIGTKGTRSETASIVIPNERYMSTAGLAGDLILWLHRQPHIRYRWVHRLRNVWDSLLSRGTNRRDTLRLVYSILNTRQPSICRKAEVRGI